MISVVPLADVSSAPTGPTPESRRRARVDELITFSLAETGLVAHEDVLVAVASGASLSSVRDAASSALDEFASEIVRTPEGFASVERGRAELDDHFDTLVMFFVRRRATDPTRALIAAATAAGGLRVAASAFGCRARIWTCAPIVAGRVAESLAARHGAFYVSADLGAVLSVDTQGEPSQIARAPSGVVVDRVWLDADPRREVHDRLSSESLRLPLERPARIALSVPGASGALLEAMLRELGHAVTWLEARDLRSLCDEADVAVVSMDARDGRAALRELGAGTPGQRVPLLAVSACAHSDMRLLGSEFRADRVLRLPALPVEMASVIAELARTGRALRAAQRTAEDLSVAHGEMVRSERMATLGWLAASIGHDLRTPLAAIRSNSALAVKFVDSMEAGSIEQRSAFATLRQLENTNLDAAERLGEIVAVLKAFSRPDEGAVRRSDVPSVLDQVLMLCRHELRSVRIERVDSPDLPQLAVSHADLMQVFMNLLGNAAAMLGESGGTVWITAERCDDTHVAITVADNGPGLSPEVQSQLFRTGMTTRAAQGGSGLGLMIVKRIVDANGGHIGVESPAGVGASFRVVFPTALS